MAGPSDFTMEPHWGNQAAGGNLNKTRMTKIDRFMHMCTGDNTTYLRLPWCMCVHMHLCGKLAATSQAWAAALFRPLQHNPSGYLHTWKFRLKKILSNYYFCLLTNKTDFLSLICARRMGSDQTRRHQHARAATKVKNSILIAAQMHYWVFAY